MREKKAKRHTVSIDSKDLYQYMIAECRYGYTRHNHLMPWGAFNHCYLYLPKLAKSDKVCAERTAIQLAEEAISELRTHTFDEKREEFSFLQVGIDETDHELKSKWEPALYRHSITLEFKALPGIEFSDRDGNVYAAISKSEDPGLLKVNLPMLGNYPKDYMLRLYRQEPGKEGWYQSLVAWGNEPLWIPEGETILLTIDKDKQDVDLKQLTGFIEYCLDFAKNSMGDYYRPPYNHGDYIAYLENHPLPAKDEFLSGDTQDKW